MKIPTPRKLPSGNWFVRVQVGGESYSITKPTEKEAIAEATALKARTKEACKKTRHTVARAIDEYIAARENVLSPSTIRGYRAIQRLRFHQAMNKCVDDITQSQWQRIVNQEAKLCSAKTLKNSWGFVSSVISEATGRKISVRLPQVIAHDLPYLTDQQIPIFLDAIRGEYCEMGVLLGLSSLRRSEIVAVKWEDIDLDAGCIYVRGAAVYDTDSNLVYREENKNTTSRRTVPFLIPRLRELVEASDQTAEYVVTCNPSSIYQCVDRVCKRVGLPKIGCHGLRRSFASLAYHLGVPEAVTMRAGGWSDIYTMRKIYTKISEQDIAEHGEKFDAFFAEIPSSQHTP